MNKLTFVTVQLAWRKRSCKIRHLVFWTGTD